MRAPLIDLDEEEEKAALPHTDRALSAPMKVLCYGSLNLDHIYNVLEFIRPGRHFRPCLWNSTAEERDLTKR